MRPYFAACLVCLFASSAFACPVAVSAVGGFAIAQPVVAVQSACAAALETVSPAAIQSFVPSVAIPSVAVQTLAVPVVAAVPQTVVVREKVVKARVVKPAGPIRRALGIKAVVK